MRHITLRAAIATTTAVLAGLSLTACQDGNGAKDAGPASISPTSEAQAQAPASTPSSGADSKTPAGGSGKDADKSGDKNGSENSSSNTRDKGADDSDPSSIATCTSANTKVTVSQVTRPINHLLLTATNTGSGRCAAYGAPALRFDEDHSVTGLIEDSKPQAVVTLDPGQSAYAAIVLSGENTEGGRIAKKLGVFFTPRGGSGSIGSPTTLTLPSDTYRTNDARVTYWLTDMADALTY
ncbi:DUF4232 domain-containing protein [Streptomyces sp. NPDC000410]|uniref:DUF4232 domain-containing protein n=1 Tax=Streptomyces sp. NPDC000410 TaxID=3154254 RepID=UPI00332546B0